ncbi:MAG: ABC transporter permease [Deltaproteobacteria bacterium]|nr:ABC transporter permease [Deltaproteobacteria bacterium]
MKTVFLLLRRTLLPERKSLMSLAIWVCVAAVAIGIAQLMLVLAVMSGFQQMLRDNYTRITSELVVMGSRKVSGLEKKLSSLKAIKALTPFQLAQGMLIKNGVGGVYIEGIDLASTSSVTPWKSIWETEPLWELQKSNPYWIWLGSQLAQKLQARPGDKVTLLVVEEGRKTYLPFVVTGITRFGIYDHDLRYAQTALKTVQAVFKRTDAENMYKLKLEQGVDEAAMAREIRAAISPRLNVRSWKDINQNIFRAVEHQKKLLFLVLEIVVGLAAVNIVSLLLMSAQLKRRDLGILRAMGLKKGQVFSFFLLKGTIVASLGIAFGVVLGLLTCELVKRFQPALLSESIYNVSRLPVRVEGVDVLTICAAALLLCMCFSIWPAWRVALSKPSEALRYE